MNETLQHVVAAIGTTGGLYYLADQAVRSVQKYRWSRAMKKHEKLVEAAPSLPEILCIEHQVRCVDCGEPVMVYVPITPPGMYAYTAPHRSCKAGEPAP
jgi:hypothetical protein